MKNLQFLTDATLTSEDLTAIKGGKKLLALKVAATSNVAISAKSGSRTVLYNGKVYTRTVNATGTALMVTGDHNKDICVEW